VSATVHAAAALLYPLHWQQIYLPLLPLALKVGPPSGPCRLHRTDAHFCSPAAVLLFWDVCFEKTDALLLSP
jgi:hypothetical protein